MHVRTFGPSRDDFGLFILSICFIYSMLIYVIGSLYRNQRYCGTFHRPEQIQSEREASSEAVHTLFIMSKSFGKVETSRALTVSFGCVLRDI